MADCSSWPGAARPGQESRRGRSTKGARSSRDGRRAPAACLAEESQPPQPNNCPWQQESQASQAASEDEMSPRAASGATRTESFACCCPCQPCSHRSARHSFAPRCRSHLHGGQSGSQHAKDTARARAQTHDPLQEQEQAQGCFPAAGTWPSPHGRHIDPTASERGAGAGRAHGEVRRILKVLRHRSPAHSTPSRAGHRGQQEQEELPAGPCLLEQHCPRSARAPPAQEPSQPASRREK